MTVSFVKKSRGEMIGYRRNNTASYMNSIGEIKNAPSGVMRFNYDDWGFYMGLKFGNGDNATIPSVTNLHWKGTPTGATLIAIGQAPVGITWLKFGDIEIQGVDGHKLHIIEIPPEQVALLPDSINIFPDGDEIDAQCHLMMVKYYHETNIDFGIEAEAMDELNTFLHGAWN